MLNNNLTAWFERNWKLIVVVIIVLYLLTRIQT